MLSDGETRDLIAALRANVHEAARGTPPTMAARILAGESDDNRLALMVKAADALEASLTVPDGDVREAALAEAEARVLGDRSPVLGYSVEEAFADGAVWALSRAAAAEEVNDEPCKAETHSWSHYQPEQIDSYWIRCTQLGKHEGHHDSNTGLRWGDV